MNWLLAHGVEGRQDLPVPISEAVIAALLALLATFVLMSQARSEPKPRKEHTLCSRAVFDVTLPSQLLGMLALAWFVWELLAGDPEQAANLVYVVLWVGVPLLSVLAGPVWRQLNPLRTIALLLRLNGLRGYPARWGRWPAALLLVAFAWLELVAPHRTSPVLIGGVAVGYALVMLAGAAVYGPDWFDHADAFEVYSSLAATLAPIGRSSDGRRLVLRNPLDGLAGLPSLPGQSAAILVLLGSTTYDGVSNAPWWSALVQDEPLPDVLTATLGLAATIALVAACYAAAIRLSGHIGGRRVTGAQFAHTLLPVALGYIVAHYFSLLFRQVSGVTIDPTLTSHLQVGAVIAGHVGATIAAHTLAGRLFAQRPTASQVPMLALMLTVTTAGLTLLFAA